MMLIGMDREVAGVAAQFAALATRLDPDDVPASYAPALWSRLDQLGRQVAAAKTLVARRVADSMIWQREGFASAADYLAARGGTSLGAARVELDTSQSLPALPATRRALLEGTVSPSQGALIAEAAKVNPTAEATLVEAAGRDSFKELKDRAQRAKAAADPDPDATQARIHRHRGLRTYTDAEGAWNLHARGAVADGAKIQAALAPVIEQIFTQRRATGGRETPEARAFDALVQIAERPGDQPPGRGRRNQALVRCDLDALHRGKTNGDEVCEIAGVGPVPVATAVDLLGDAAVKLLITRGVDVLNVTTLSRKATAAMVAALAWRSPTCTAEGCGRTITQIDHRLPWASTRHTTLDELDQLCGHHHDNKTYDGWALTNGTGKRPFVPPHDPRHPRHTRDDQPPQPDT